MNIGTLSDRKTHDAIKICVENQFSDLTFDVEFERLLLIMDKY